MWKYQNYSVQCNLVLLILTNIQTEVILQTPKMKSLIIFLQIPSLDLAQIYMGLTLRYPRSNKKIWRRIMSEHRYTKKIRQKSNTLTRCSEAPYFIITVFPNVQYNYNTHFIITFFPMKHTIWSSKSMHHHILYKNLQVPMHHYISEENPKISFPN